MPIKIIDKKDKSKSRIIKTPCKNCRAKNIARGFGKIIAEAVLGGEPEDWVLDRAEICAKCDARTFLNVLAWGIGFIKNESLPIYHQPGRFDRLWCSECSCCIEAKIRVKEEKCPIGLWPDKEQDDGTE